MSDIKDDSITILNCSNQTIEEFERQPKQFNFDIKQLSPGCFLGHSTSIDLGDILILRKQSNTRYTSIGTFNNYLVCIFPLQNKNFTSNRYPYGKGSQLVLSNNLNSCSLFPENFDQLIFAIKTDSLEKYLTIYKAHELLKITKSEKLSVNEYEREQTKNTLLSIYSDLLKNAKPNTSPKPYCHKIVSILYDYLKPQLKNGKSRPTNYGKIFHRALHFIDNNPQVPIDLNTLSSHIYASKRSVQYAFSKKAQLPPILFIKIFKMNQIRKRLLNSEHNKVGVSDILHKYQITNFGRFSHEYFELFGERPKDTLFKDVTPP